MEASPLLSAIVDGTLVQLREASSKGKLTSFDAAEVGADG